MKLELKEHELERVIEVYLQLQFNKEVKVNGFDLSGMRSKEGLSAMVDFTLVGESDVREPKTESSNVSVTNTSWREERKSEPKESKPDLEGKDLEDWTTFLGLIMDNAMYKQYDNIMDLLEQASDIVKEKIRANELFIEMEQEVEKQIASVVNETISEPKETIIEEIFEPSEEEQESKPEVEPEIPTDEYAEAITAEVEHIQESQPKSNIFGSPLGKKPSNLGNTVTAKAEPKPTGKPLFKFGNK